MRPVVFLAELNDADQAVDSIAARLAQIAEALREPAAVRAARSALAQAESELARSQAMQLQREAAQNDAAGKLSSTEQKLYGGKVRSPKELEDLQGSQANLRRLQSQREDELLEALVAVEAATAERDRCHAALAGLTAEWEAAQVRLRAEQAQLQTRLKTAQARQAAARRAAPAELLPLYDSLRSRRAGRAVAELEGETCSACRVAVSPTRLEAARYGTELVYCENCGRLLWGE